MELQLDRRLELLELEGQGFSTPDIVKSLSVKYQVTPRTIYGDFECRQEWQPSVTSTDPKRALLKCLNRYEHVYQEASFLYRTTQNDNVKLNALNCMRETNGATADLLRLNDIPVPDAITHVNISWGKHDGDTRAIVDDAV